MALGKASQQLDLLDPVSRFCEERLPANSIFAFLAGQREVPWRDVAGIRVAPRGDLWLVTTHGTELHLPVMRARDLPRLAALSGGRIDVPPVGQ